MGGTRPAVLGLLCLLSRAVLPGFAQEFSTNQNADPRTDVPTAATSPSLVISAVSGDNSSSVSGFTDGDGKDNGTISGTDPPPSEGPPTIVGSEAGVEIPAITEAPQETNSSGEAAPSQAYADPETRGATRTILTQPSPTTNTLSTYFTEEATTGIPSSHTMNPPDTPTTQNTETPPVSTQPAATATALHTDWTPTTAGPTNPIRASAEPAGLTESTATPHRGRSEAERDPALQEVGDHRDSQDYHHGGPSNPLFVMIVSVFTVVVVMVVVVIGFHRYKKRNRRSDFRRLQDLDDMMEDTPLALYNY